MPGKSLHTYVLTSDIHHQVGNQYTGYSLAVTPAHRPLTAMPSLFGFLDDAGNS